MRLIGWRVIAGPLLFILIFALGSFWGEMSWQASVTAAIAAWMAWWWISESVPAAVTALMPLVLFPVFGVMPLKTASAEFGNEIIFLFLAGFFYGKSIERWSLHQRIALHLVGVLGVKPNNILLGFMLATAFVSMFISNTATAVMMTPVALAVAEGVRKSGASEGQDGGFRKALMLGVAYACSIGGLATIVGTPTNAVFLGFLQQKFGTTVSFGKWFMVGFPFAAALLALTWLLLYRLFPMPPFAKDQALIIKDSLNKEKKALGPFTSPERRMVLILGTVVALWISGSLGGYRLLPMINDSVVAIAGALALFLTPANRKKDGSLLDWETASKIPWGILLFFGGGLALAKGFDVSGLASWMGGKLSGMKAMPQPVILLVVLVVVVFLSELASNIATASMMMPVLAALAGSVGMDPFGLMLSATLAASFGFGLPIATAPNSIVYSSGYLRSADMAKAGFLLDLIAIFLLMIFIYVWIPIIW